MSNLGCIASNPDVSGIGIRVNLYATTILMSLIPDIPHTARLREVLIANAGVSGLALLITAVIQTAQQQLSLYHAIFIVHVLFFLGVNLFPSGQYRWTTLRAVIALLTTYLIMFMFTGWAIYIWATAPQFGPPIPELESCNNAIKYLVFFKPVRATVGWLRKLWLAGLGIAAVMLVYPMVVGVLLVCGLGMPPFKCAGTSKFPGKGILVAVYDVVMLELYVKHNKPLVSTGENQWAFGQIMALIMIISTLNEVVHFILALRHETLSSELDYPPASPDADAAAEAISEFKGNEPAVPGATLPALPWRSRLSTRLYTTSEDIPLGSVSDAVGSGIGNKDTNIV